MFIAYYTDGTCAEVLRARSPEHLLSQATAAGSAALGRIDVICDGVTPQTLYYVTRTHQMWERELSVRVFGCLRQHYRLTFTDGSGTAHSFEIAASSRDSLMFQAGKVCPSGSELFQITATSAPRETVWHHTKGWDRLAAEQANLRLN